MFGGAICLRSGREAATLPSPVPPPAPPATYVHREVGGLLRTPPHFGQRQGQPLLYPLAEVAGPYVHVARHELQHCTESRDGGESDPLMRTMRRTAKHCSHRCIKIRSTAHLFLYPNKMFIWNRFKYITINAGYDRLWPYQH